MIPADFPVPSPRSWLPNRNHSATSIEMILAIVGERWGRCRHRRRLCRQQYEIVPGIVWQPDSGLNVSSLHRIEPFIYTRRYVGIYPARECGEVGRYVDTVRETIGYLSGLSSDQGYPGWNWSCCRRPLGSLAVDDPAKIHSPHSGNFM